MFLIHVVFNSDFWNCKLWSTMSIWLFFVLILVPGFPKNDSLRLQNDSIEQCNASVEELLIAIQDSDGISLTDTNNIDIVYLDSLRERITSLETIYYSQVLGNRNVDAASVSDNSVLNFANTVISIAAMIFGFLTLVIIIAGVIGLKEFSSIRQREKELSSLSNEMTQEISTFKEELERFKSDREEIIEEMNLIRKQFQDKVETDIERTVELFYLLNEGAVKRSQGRSKEALSVFNEATKLFPNNYKARCHLAEAYLDERAYSDAEKHAQQAKGLNENRQEAYRILGKTYREWGRYDNAVEVHLQGIDIKKDHSMLSSLGYVYLLSDALDEAIRMFKESKELRNSSTGHCGLGIALTLSSRYIEAKASFQDSIRAAEDSIQSGSSSPYLYHNKAFSEMALGYHSAIESLDIALKKNKNPSILDEHLRFCVKIKDFLDQPNELLDNYIKKLELAFSARSIRD